MCPLFIESHQKRSTCSQSATDRGLEQKVISYSFYGPLTSAYFNGIFENLAGVKMYYPGYVMRLYLDRLKAIEDNQGFMQKSLLNLELDPTVKKNRYRTDSLINNLFMTSKIEFSNSQI